jgi:hypothetical protein
MMKMKIWTVAADDDAGTRATVHLSQRAAYEQWLEWQFSGELDDEEKKDAKAAAAFIEREDYDGLWNWKGGREFGEPFDTYAIEEHEIELPTD